MVGADEGRVPYCLNWTYLQMVIDDPWLWLPKQWADDVKTDASLAHSLVSGPDYVASLRKEVGAKVPAVLLFARLLGASWNVEVRERPSLGLVKDLGPPDFLLVYQELVQAVEGVGAQAGVSVRRAVIDFRAALADGSFEEAFAEYFREAQRGAP